MDLQLANRLQRHRKAHGYSQEALAAALGISRQAVSKWECGEASPDTENLIRLAKLYHISLDELILSDEARSDALAPAERSETSPNVGAPSKTEDETFHGGEKKRESEGEASDNRNDAEDAPKELAEFIKKLLLDFHGVLHRIGYPHNLNNHLCPPYDWLPPRYATTTA